jgi:hypothetical protein
MKYYTNQKTKPLYKTDFIHENNWFFEVFEITFFD